MVHQEPRVEVTSPFWTRLRELVVKEVLPYQWHVINGEIDVEIPADPSGNDSTGGTRSHAVRNLRIAAGENTESFDGVPFIDTDVFKWLEAVAYSLQYEPDDDLRKLADNVVDLIARAQQDDGYLDTFIQLTAPDRRFRRLQQSHELYIMGHYIEAGVAYWEATQNQQALDVAVRMADCIARDFGDGPGKIRGVDGHPEIEIALARLAVATGRDEYARLSQWFIKIRGTDPEFFDRQNREDGWDRDILKGMKSFPPSYYQMDKPVIERETADGHAVREVYLCIGMAHVGRLLGDDDLLKAAKRLWKNIVYRRMYITGQIGSTHVGESFTYDYDLPNTTMYGETCASVAMSFFARQMLHNEASGEYGDVLEKELFNGTISGMALDGQHFYYVNPMEADPKASLHNPDRRHVLTQRARWFLVACCPSNLARMIASVDRAIYTQQDNGTILAHQYIASTARFDSGLVVEQRGNFPWEGDVTWEVHHGGSDVQRFGVRIPGWSTQSFTLVVNGASVTPEVVDGFVYLNVQPGDDTTIELHLDMSIRRVRASNRVAADEGKVAIMRGPLVYCAEQADNPQDLWRYAVDSEPPQFEIRPNLLGGVGVIIASAQLAQEDGEGQMLYLDAARNPEQWAHADLTLVPYYSWANRGEGQMRVWFNMSAA